jgi:hypothetical protein
VEAVFVAEGEVVEEVFDGENAAFGEAGGDARADALDGVYGCGELERHGFDGSSGSGADGGLLRMVVDKGELLINETGQQTSWMTWGMDGWG